MCNVNLSNEYNAPKNSEILQNSSNKKSSYSLNTKENEFIQNTKKTIRNVDAIQFFDHMKNNTILTLKEINGKNWDCSNSTNLKNTLQQ